MKKAILATSFLCILVVAGCAGTYQAAPERIHGIYFDQIKEWQKRIQENGWSRQDLDDVVQGCLKYVKYEAETDDHWDTPQEFMNKGFRGDCEDIAVFMMATLRRLQYPRSVRILAVKTLMGDHAVLKVEMPDGSSKMYETVPVPLIEIDQLFYRPIVEFDENTIVYYKSGSDQSDGLAR
ncbi:MAG: hypothetical protein AB1512_27145 [Thermodesulfobacteriota bacterium]